MHLADIINIDSDMAKFVMEIAFKGFNKDEQIGFIEVANKNNFYAWFKKDALKENLVEKINGIIFVIEDGQLILRFVEKHKSKGEGPSIITTIVSLFVDSDFEIIGTTRKV